MTETLTGPAVDPGDVTAGASGGRGAADDARDRAARRRRNAVRWCAVLTVVALGGLGWMGLQGYDAATKIKGGAQATIVTDPSAAGFVAAVTPSPVHMLALTDADDSLSALFLLVPATTGGGGSVVWSLGELIIEVDGEKTSLASLYGGDGDAAARVATVRSEYEKVLGFGVTDITVVGPTELAALIEPVGALTFKNPDRVSVEENGKRVEQYKAGSITLEPDEISEYLTVRGAGEAPENRAIRASIVMDAIFTGYQALAAPPQATVVTDIGVSIAEVLGAVAAGSHEFIVLPTERQAYETSFLYSPDPAGIAESLGDVVQFPISSFPGQRPRVRILNGTADATRAKAVAPQVARAGGEVLLIGNNPTFDVAATSVVYSNSSFEAVAQRTADIFGVTAVRSEALSDAADIDVVLGADYTG